MNPKTIAMIVVAIILVIMIMYVYWSLVDLIFGTFT